MNEEVDGRLLATEDVAFWTPKKNKNNNVPNVAKQAKLNPSSMASLMIAELKMLSRMEMIHKMDWVNMDEHKNTEPNKTRSGREQ